jgi:DNA-binding NarL/FixJ family response regulator
MPMGQARNALCAAETLRRTRGFTAVRPRLREALSLFEGLGARPWAARAEAELAADGVHTVGRLAANGLLPLTKHELRIAEAAANGLTNSEVAAALFISTKTVESNLTRVYRKLGLQSRTELARILPSA